MLDAHAHLQFSEFDEDIADVLVAAADVGVTGVIIADYDSALRARSCEISKRSGVWYCAGVHPWAVTDGLDVEAEVGLVAESLQDPNCVAIGELGLDWIRAKGDRLKGVQEDVFRALLDLARSQNRPIVIHCVKAEERLLAILKADGVPEAGGIMHSYSGSAEQAQQFLRLGLEISIGTSITRRNARRVLEVVKRTPMTALHIETDSPDRPPEVLDIERNEPAFLPYVAKAMANTLEISVEKVSRFSEENTRRLFDLGSATLGEVEVPHHDD